MTPRPALPAYLTTPGWESHSGLVHGFFGRGEDGAQGDTEIQVALGVAVTTDLHLPRQVHGATILTVREDSGPRLGDGDAVITDRPGVLIGVATADCVPILVIAPAARVCAAIHAGWRGTAAEITRKTVAALADRFRLQPRDLHAAIGPAICGPCYEVGDEVVDALTAALGAHAACGITHPNGARPHADLRTINRALLIAAGLSPDRVHLVGACTACDSAFPCHSYRRDAQAAGRQLSVIGWLPNAG
ncbi:MAG: peptidoglycan editing factor PgeF [Nitrospirota bacterium]|jgi:YfiH family protein